MSIKLVEVFTAPDDATAAESVAEGPAGTDVIGLDGNSDVVPNMVEWESVLLGRLPEEHATAAPPRIVADDGDQIFALSAEFQSALTSADHGRLMAAANEWVERFGPPRLESEPDRTYDLFVSLSDLARAATARQHGMYFWRC